MIAKHEIKKADKAESDTRRFLEKIIINAGVGRLSSQPNFEEKGLIQVSRDLAALGGQKPQVRRAKKSIAGFKIREGQIVGLRVTLRRKKMFDFFHRFINIVLPRVRDFRGISLDSIDNGGALNIGLKEQFVFPEVNPEQSPISFSLGISMVPRKRNRREALENFRRLGAPLKKS
jgi:large subunit ribosomal protein L5